MKLSCPSCAAKYSIADEKVQDRLAKIRCRKCSATIIVDGKVDPPNVYTSDGGAADAADAGGGGSSGGAEYSVDFGDNDQRTMSVDDIVQAYRRGEVTAEMFVWAEGFGDWTAMSEVPELAGALGLGAAAPAAPPRAAARSGAGRGSATDLFGGIETAGSEDDVMTSAPQGGGAPAPAVAATGARNESSVLFSLSALTASAPASPMAAAPKASAPSAVSNGKDDDSGLIDLKALTSAVSNQAPMNPLSLGTAPLGMAAPLGGMTAPAVASDGPMPKQGGSKTGIYIAAALVVVGALIAGAIVVTGNKEPPPAPVAAVAPPPTAAPAPPPEPKPEQPTAAPPATGTAEAAKDAPKTASATKAVAVAHVGGGSKPKASSSSGSSSSSSSSSSSGSSDKPEKSSSSSSSSSDTGSSDAPKKKKKEKTCNCSPGDLMCAMKCAAS